MYCPSKLTMIRPSGELLSSEQISTPLAPAYTLPAGVSVPSPHFTTLFFSFDPLGPSAHAVAGSMTNMNAITASTLARKVSPSPVRNVADSTSNMTRPRHQHDSRHDQPRRTV